MTDVKIPGHFAAIFARMDRAGKKQKDLADAIGVTEEKISKTRTGKRRFTAEELEAARQWLESIEVEPDQPLVIQAGAGETVEIPMLDLTLSMGSGTEVDDYIEENRVVFDLGYIRSFTRTPAHRLRLAKGVGESMAPTLLSYDQVWIDTSLTKLNQQDRIWAISLYGAAAIKRLRKISATRVLVISDNPMIDDQEVDESDLLIGGRVIRFVRDL